MKRLMIFTISLFTIILLSACSSLETSDAIVLPAPKDIVSISIISDGITATCIDKEQIGEFMSILADMELTTKSSVDEFPAVNNYVTINFNCSDETTKTVFFYEDNEKQYVEQSYQGIYIPAPALGTRITDMLNSVNDDNPIEKITWEEITEEGVDEELLLSNIDTEVLTQVATELQTLVDEALAEERDNPMILITEGWARVLEYERFKKVLDIGAPAMKPLYLIIYKSPNRGEYEYLCSYALYKLSDFDFEWSTTDEFMEKFNEQILEERQ